jgi:hypothetical protein
LHILIPMGNRNTNKVQILFVCAIKGTIIFLEMGKEK